MAFEDVDRQTVELAGGGEPLLHPAFLDAVALLKRRRFNVSLVTNASRMEPEHSEQMVRLGVDRLTVSLNAGTADTYARIHTNAGASTFERIALSLADLRRRKQAGG